LDPELPRDEDEDEDARTSQLPPSTEGCTPEGGRGESRLIWAASHASMGSHIMKTTIEIADDLFERAQRLARKEKTTFRSLTEQGLRLVLKEKQSKPRELPQLVTVRGNGLTEEYKNASWDKIRDEIYRGRGA
jgi:hypothetical protein